MESDIEIQKLSELVQFLDGKLAEHESAKNEARNRGIGFIAPLKDSMIDEIANRMPCGMDGFLKHWGWRQFARAVEEAHGIRA